jgi:hypothetical protein
VKHWKDIASSLGNRFSGIRFVLSVSNQLVVTRALFTSTQRLLFTILQNKQDRHSPAYKKLTHEIEKIIREELYGRSYALSQGGNRSEILIGSFSNKCLIGVRELSGIVALKPNVFETVDDQATEYDDMRSCSLCKQTCLFTAVACECDQSQVACLRHYHLMCKCPFSKKFLLSKRF